MEEGGEDVVKKEGEVRKNEGMEWQEGDELITSRQSSASPSIQ